MLCCYYAILLLAKRRAMIFRNGKLRAEKGRQPSGVGTGATAGAHLCCMCLGRAECEENAAPALAPVAEEKVITAPSKHTACLAT